MAGKRLASSDKVVRSGAAVGSSSVLASAPAQYAAEPVGEIKSMSIAATLSARAEDLNCITARLQSTLQDLGLIVVNPSNSVDKRAEGSVFDIKYVLENDLSRAFTFINNLTLGAIHGDNEPVQDESGDSDDDGEARTQQPVEATAYGRKIYSEIEVATLRIECYEQRLESIRSSMLGGDKSESLDVQRLNGESVQSCVSIFLNHVDGLINTLDRLNGDLRFNLMGGL